MSVGSLPLGAWECTRCGAFNGPRALTCLYCGYKPRVETEAPRTGCDEESELHSHIIEECKARGLLYGHGSMAHKTHYTPGWPDFVIVKPPAYVAWDHPILFVECKTKTGKLTPEQRAVEAHLRKLGQTLHVVRSIEEFKALL